MREDASYYAKLTSPFCPISVCLHAFRSPDIAFGPVGSIVVPAQTQFMVRYPACHSTLLCLQYEARFAANHPFRKAQDQRNYFAHQTESLEDTTSACYMMRAGRTVD